MVVAAALVTELQTQRLQVEQMEIPGHQGRVKTEVVHFKILRLLLRASLLAVAVPVELAKAIRQEPRLGLVGLVWNRLSLAFLDFLQQVEGEAQLALHTLPVLADLQ